MFGKPLAACALVAALAGEEPERLRVLFLGDRGHHEPEARCDQVVGPLARLGIDLWFRADLDALSPEKLALVDVLLIYANHDAIAPAQERALLDFVATGGGLVAVHCASYCFRNSEKYVALVGGQFDHHEMGEFTARTVAAGHPALRGVAEFATTDETYVHRALASGSTLLQVRDEGGRAEPYTWVREPGKGRVYYTALGHDARTWGQPAFQAQLAQAIRWAAGRPDFAFAPPKTEEEPAKLPNYTPGERWGSEGAAITRLQKPLPPGDERRTFQLPPGFDALLFAAEPDVVKPIALSFDAKGRAWVLESVDYPNDKLPRDPSAGSAPPRGRDRVKILEDRDGDGCVDSTKLFAEGLNVATGLVCTEDGCIVAQAPDMLRFVDRDGDDRADERRILFTGFGEGDTHAGPSNLRRGPDGWIWGTVGYSAFHGRVADADGSAVDQQFGQAVFRFDPDERRGPRLERIASTTNNTWGLSFDEQGEIFVSTANGDHLVHVAVPSPAIDSVFGLAAKQADGTVHAPDHDRLHPLTALRQVDYHGGFTAAAGCSIYTGRAFPPEYWNRCAFVCEPTGHLVHQCFLEPAGSTFVARDGRNLLSSFDEWCAPIAAEVGPDGAVWVLDWYSPVVQHNPTPHGFTTGKGNAYETPHRDKQHGRVWRLVWKEGATGGAGAAGSAGAALPSPSAELRRELLLPRDRVSASFAAAALETWRSARAADDRPLALAAEIALARAWGVSLPALLAQEDESQESNGGEAERDDEPGAASPLLVNADFAARAASWRAVGYGGIAVQRWNESGHVAAGSGQITSPDGADASLSQSVKVRPHARYRLSGWIKTEGITPIGDAYGALFNVHELQAPRVVTPAVTGTHDWRRVEVEFDSGDHDELTINCLLGGWGRASGTAWYDDVALELVAAGSPLAELVELVAANAAHADAAKAAAAILVRLAAADPALLRAAFEGAVCGWPKSPASPPALTPALAARLRAASSRLDVAGRAALLLFAEKLGRLDLFPDEVARVRAELLARLADEGAPSIERTDAAARALALGPAAEIVPLIGAQLSALAEPELVKGLLRALGECAAPEVGGEVARRARDLSATTLPGAVELLLRRPEWTKQLLAQLDARRLDAKSLAADVLERLRRSDDAEIAAAAERIAQSLGRPRNADRAKVVESWLRLAASGAPRGDARHGREVFEAKCAKCHAILEKGVEKDGRKGGAVGPELTAIGKRGKADLLLEILDPNRSVEGTYRAWEATTRGGDEFTGRLVNEGRATIEIVDATAARHVIARDDLVQLRPLAVSLMPEGLEEMGEADLAALLEFLVEQSADGGR